MSNRLTLYREIISTYCTHYTQHTHAHYKKMLLLSTFAEFRNAFISFDMSVCPSVPMVLLGSHWADFN